MYTLGISALYHDSAAALLEDGEIIAAAQEERFTRIKGDAQFPKEAIRFCMEQANISPKDIDTVIFYEKPFLKFERLIETYLHVAPRGLRSFSKSIPLWLKGKLYQKQKMQEALFALGWPDNKTKIHFSDHHLSHAASAFYPSPFEDAVILTMDAVGEWATTTIAVGAKNHLEIKEELHFPHSLGMLYTSFTQYLGFKVNSGEYKVMGLAPYGSPKYKTHILDHLIDLKDDGSFALNLKYFNYCHGLTMVNKEFEDLFGAPTRLSESDITSFHMDIAASIQAVTEDIVLRICKHISKKYPQKNLCLAGGVALNCVANGKLLNQKYFDHIWIQPAAGDAGGALGAAYAGHYMAHKQQRTTSSIDQMRGAYLGPHFSSKDCSERLTRAGAHFVKMDRDCLTDKVAKDLSDGKAIGWFQGRMEFGPRALGNRSILGDARSLTMQQQLNLKIKFRESFRPFAPSVLFEDLKEWFQLDVPSPYMLLVADIADSRRIDSSEKLEDSFMERLKAERSQIQAVTHINNSARVQTVHKETNPRYHDLISKFKAITGCPVIVNTSFNIRGEPIVCTPEDAFQCFMGTDLDILVIEDLYLEKSTQSKELLRDYRNEFRLD